MTKIVQEDIQRIYAGLSDAERRTLSGKTVLVTGYAGSLGYLLMQFLRAYGESLEIPRVIGIDNFQFGRPVWVDELRADPRFQLIEGDITVCGLSPAADAQIILHMASLASPVYYRLHPIETIDADVIGLRRLLDFYRDREIYSLLFFLPAKFMGIPRRIRSPRRKPISAMSIRPAPALVMTSPNGLAKPSAITITINTRCRSLSSARSTASDPACAPTISGL